MYSYHIVVKVGVWPQIWCHGKNEMNVMKVKKGDEK